MMGPVCWSLTLPLLLGAAQDDLPNGWVKHAPADGRYSIAMPAKPTETKRKITRKNDEIDTVIAIAEGKHDSSFVVSYTDFPDKELKPESIEQRLDQGVKAAVENARGNLKSDKPIKLDGHPGRDIVIEKDGEVIARMRLFLVERRLYQLMVLGTDRIFAAKEKDVDTFFNSFRLIK
jgi:hypothetical protein